MEEHLSALTKWVNDLFGPMALALLHSLHVQPANYEAPIPEYVVMSLQQGEKNHINQVIGKDVMIAPAQWAWTKTPVHGAILGIFPLLVPIAFIGLHIFVSFIQAYVFTVLPAVYLGLATPKSIDARFTASGREIGPSLQKFLLYTMRWGGPLCRSGAQIV